MLCNACKYNHIGVNRNTSIMLYLYMNDTAHGGIFETKKQKVMQSHLVLFYEQQYSCTSYCSHRSQSSLKLCIAHVRPQCSPGATSTYCRSSYSCSLSCRVIVLLTFFRCTHRHAFPGSALAKPVHPTLPWGQWCIYLSTGSLIPRVLRSFSSCTR